MISWFKYPFIRLLVPFAIGIMLAFSLNIFSVEENVIRILLIILFFLLISLIVISESIKSYHYRWIFSSLLFIYLILLGFSFVKIRDFRLIVNDITKMDNIPKYYLARLCECPMSKEKSVKVMLEFYAFEEDDNVKSMDSKIIAYFEKDEKSINLKYGDCVALFANPDEVEKPPNPEQFDYKDYL